MKILAGVLTILLIYSLLYLILAGVNGADMENWATVFAVGFSVGVVFSIWILRH